MKGAAPFTERSIASYLSRIIFQRKYLLLVPNCYTLIPFTHGKPAADGPRYKALGNSMAVPVMRWIGERIAMVAEVA